MTKEEELQEPQEPELKVKSSQAREDAEEPNSLISTEQNAALMDEWWFRRRDPYCT